MADPSRDTQRVERTAVKPGRRAPGGARQQSSGRRSSPRATRVGSAGAARRGEAGRAARTVPGRNREIVALVMFGVAVFLFFVVIAGAKGGFAGRAAEAGLSGATGRLAFLVPVALLCFSVTTVLEFRVRRAPWFAGVVVFLFGLFLLMAAGFPPIGGHAPGELRADLFRGAVGGLGEALYVLLHRVVGGPGVGIIGWLTLLAGVGLATGLTLRKLGSGTKRTALAVKAGAESATIRMRTRNDQAFAGAGHTLGGFDELHSVGGPRLGPVDLVSQLQGSEDPEATLAMGLTRSGPTESFR